MPQFSLGLCSVINLGKLEPKLFLEVRDPLKLAKTRSYEI